MDDGIELNIEDKIELQPTVNKEENIPEIEVNDVIESN